MYTHMDFLILLDNIVFSVVSIKLSLFDERTIILSWEFSRFFFFFLYH